ncbi:MAG: AraC family transcriptional regulator [Sphaerochaetaceae bacterium]|jgi:two-component system response regulator YesN|nr:AraC family transcriptional regulator [Sphaerochaetaceae bacterium]HHU87953.1 AraC family transcriptional regulator [Spirochaetales bacterium]
MEENRDSNETSQEFGFMSDSLNLIQLEQKYEFEQEILHFIKWGNPFKMEELLERRKRLFPDLICSNKEIPSEALRCCKNELVALNALCRYAARLGGLQSLYLYSLYNKYYIMIERAISMPYLNDHLYDQMVLDYAKAVFEFSITSYSPLIKKVVTYLMINLNQDIPITQLGELYNTHISHISRKFKRETGMSIPAYVSKQRIGVAKLYFEDGKTSIQEVASFLGFNDSNYFSKVFKRYAGMTPSEYIASIQVE